MKMDAKMKQCFTPHVIMHSFVGLGLGLILADIWPGLAKWWLGLTIIVLAAIADTMRKD